MGPHGARCMIAMIRGSIKILVHHIEGVENISKGGMSFNEVRLMSKITTLPSLYLPEFQRNAKVPC